MDFFSHGEENENKEFIPTKRLIHHLQRVTERMTQNVSANTGFTKLDAVKLKVITQYAGMLHDFGKYTTFFQEYLRGNQSHGTLKNHALISGLLAFNFFKNYHPDPKDPQKIIPYFLYYCIRSHHGSLKNVLQEPMCSFEWVSLLQDLQLQKANIAQNISQIQQEYRIEGINIDLSFIEFPEKEIKFIPNWLQTRLASIENYFQILYLFSLLIEADKIDASKTNCYLTQPLPGNAVNHFIQQKAKTGQLNQKREEVRQKILNQLEQIDLKRHYIFTLTAPTGIGKTLASLNFVLHLREKIRKLEKIEPLVIYTLPFINIIEQTVREFEKVFKPYGIKITKHHQYTDLFNDTDDVPLPQLLMQLETWQGDLIVTTFVQLLQTIIGNRNSLLKKFHRLANSIIVLDEVQNIDVKYWPLIGATFYFLAKFLNARIIFMTATQPLIFKTATDHILAKESISLDDTIFQLLPDFTDYFHQLHRTKLVPQFETILKDEKDFLELFQSKWQPDRSALIVVNTIARSLSIFNAIQEYINEHCQGIRLFYLSTNIIPKCRQIVIHQIRKALQRGEKLILVATQCIEAGVDLDFDLGFRDLGPLDSIIQVAGRINRNDTRPNPAPLYIMEFEKDATQIYGAILPIRTKMVLQNFKQLEINEPDYLTLIQNYYELITNHDGKSMQASIEIYNAMKKLRFTRLQDESELAVQDFQLIDSRLNYADVYVTINPTAKRIFEQFKKYYLNESDPLKKQEAYLKLKKNFYIHIISVPKKKITDLENYKLFEDMYYIPQNKLEVYYDLNSGFIRKPDEAYLIF